MGLINWIFDIYQHTRIDDARREAAAARAEVSSIRSGGGNLDTARLIRAIEELALSTKALQRTLIEKGVCTQGEFEARLRAIDLEDGVQDGRTPLI